MSSSFVVSAPRRSTAHKFSGTPRFAERFRALLHSDPAKTLPFVNPDSSARAQRSRAQRVTIDDAVSVIGSASELRAVALLRAVIEDAGHSRIDVALSPAAVREMDTDTLERETAVTAARFVSACDDVIRGRSLHTSRDQRELHELQIGLEARMRALLNRADRDDS